MNDSNDIGIKEGNWKFSLTRYLYYKQRYNFIVGRKKLVNNVKYTFLIYRYREQTNNRGERSRLGW